MKQISQLIVFNNFGENQKLDEIVNLTKNLTEKSKQNVWILK